MGSPPISHCRWCRAEIIWVKNMQTGRVAPLDAEPSAQGNCYWDPELSVYIIVPKTTRARPEYAGRLRTNHWATCPDNESEQAQRYKPHAQTKKEKSTK